MRPVAMDTEAGEQQFGNLCVLATARIAWRLCFVKVTCRRTTREEVDERTSVPAGLEPGPTWQWREVTRVGWPSTWQQTFIYFQRFICF